MESVITELLARARAGDRTALDELAPINDQLLYIAHRIRRGNPGLTLKAAALVEEAWLRLTGDSRPDYQSHAHFFCLAAAVMRQIVISEARSTRQASYSR